MNKRVVPPALVSLAWALALTALAALPALAQSLPSPASLAGLEQRLSPAQLQKAERLVQKAESGNFTPAQSARLRELERKPGAGAARAQAEQALAARKAQAASGSKVDNGPGLRLPQHGQAGLAAGTSAGTSAGPNNSKWAVPADWSAKGR